MRRSNLPITILTVAAFLAIVLYIGSSLFSSLTDTLRTVALESVTVGDAVDTEGVMIRQEQLLPGGAYVLVTAQEGDKVARGQQIAVHYSGQEALVVAARLKETQLRLAQIDAILGGGSTNDYALDSVLSLARTLQDGDLTALDDDLVGVRSYVFGSGYDKTALSSERVSLQSQITQLQNQLAAGADPLSVGDPGVFSAYTDGFEHLSPAKLTDLSPAMVDDLLNDPMQLPENVLGKLITGTTWYYVTTLSAEDAAKLTPGRSVLLNFSRTYGESLTMTVESVGSKENDRCAVVFSSSRYISDLTQVRQMYAEVVFESVAGFSIPLEALHMDDTGPYLYIITNQQAEKVYVRVDGTTDASYIVNETETNKLYAGVEVISAANDLYDGKVVR